MPKVGSLTENRTQPAIRQFTDREDLREAFHSMVRRAVEEEFAGAAYVINYYGVGGVGKSTLLEKLSREVKECYGSRAILLRVNFDDASLRDGERVLTRFRDQITYQDSKAMFPLLDLALYLLQEAGGRVVKPEEKKARLLENPVLSMTMELLGALVPGMSFVKTAAELLKSAGDLLDGRRSDELRRKRQMLDKHWSDSLRQYAVQMQSAGTADLLRALPLYFALDVNHFLASKEGEEQPILFAFLDTYEAYVSYGEGSGRDPDSGVDKWLYGSGGLIRSLPNTVFAVAGREKLVWERLDPFWGDKLCLDTHLTDALSEGDSAGFLRSCGLPQELCAPLYRLTGGQPLYLDLCVDQYEAMVSLGKMPAAADFGDRQGEIISRHLNYIDPMLHDILFAMAVMGSWSDGLYDAIAPALRLPILHHTESGYERLMNISYIFRDRDTGLRRMHQVVAAALRDRLTEERLMMLQNALLDVEGEEKETALRAAWQTGLRCPTGELGKELNDIGVKKTRDCRCEEAISWYRMSVEIWRKLPDQRENLGWVLYNLADELHVMHQYSESLSIVETCVEQFCKEYPKGIPGEYYKLYTYFFMAWGVLCAELDRFDDALEILENLKQALLKLSADNVEERMLSVIGNRAGILRRMKRYDEAAELSRKWVELSRKLYGETAKETLGAKNALALDLGYLGRLEEALPLGEQVVECADEFLGENHPETLTARHNLAVTYTNAGRMEDAVEQFRRVITAYTELYGADHPETLRTVAALASIHGYLGRHEEALALKEQVWKVNRKTLGEDHGDTIDAMERLSASYANLDRHEEALPLDQKILEVRLRTLGEEHPDALTSMGDLAYTYSALGRYKEALPLRERVWEVRKRTLGEEHPDTLTAMLRVATVCYDLERYEESATLGERGLDACRRVLGEDAPETLTAMNNLAHDYSKLGRHEEAVALERAAMEGSVRVNGEAHAKTLKYMNRLARFLREAGGVEEADRLQARHDELSKKSGA